MHVQVYVLLIGDCNKGGLKVESKVIVQFFGIPGATQGG